MTDLLLSLIQPLLSGLFPILFFTDLYSDSPVFVRLYLLMYLLFHFISIPVFRAFTRKNLYVFEDLGSALTERVILALLIISVGANLLLLPWNPFPLFSWIPFYASLLFSYLLSLYPLLRNTRISGIVRLAYGHLRKCQWILWFFIFAKVLLLIVLFIIGYDLTSFRIPFLVGMGTDLLFLLYVRILRQKLDWDKEGLMPGGSNSFSLSNFTLLFSSCALMAIFFSGNRSLLNPRLLKDFFQWLNSLFKDMDRNEMPMTLEMDNSGPTPDEMEGMRLYWENRALDLAFLRKIYEVVEVVLLVVLIAIIVIFIFYPLFSPWFSRQKKRITFREYYLALWKGILSFLKNLKTLFLPDRNSQEVKVLNSAYDSGAIRVDQQPLSPAKKAEIRLINRLYRHLRKKSAVMTGCELNRAMAVNDFFNSISQIHESFESCSDKLSPLYNRAFFSRELLSRSERQVLKEKTGQLLKTMKTVLR